MIQKKNISCHDTFKKLPHPHFINLFKFISFSLGHTITYFRVCHDFSDMLIPPNIKCDTRAGDMKLNPTPIDCKKFCQVI